MPIRALRLLLTLLVTACVAACGGGGSSTTRDNSTSDDSNTGTSSGTSSTSSGNTGTGTASSAAVSNGTALELGTQRLAWMDRSAIDDKGVAVKLDAERNLWRFDPSASHWVKAAALATSLPTAGDADNLLADLALDSQGHAWLAWKSFSAADKQRLVRVDLATGTVNVISLPDETGAYGAQGRGATLAPDANGRLTLAWWTQAGRLLVAHVSAGATQISKPVMVGTSTPLGSVQQLRVNAAGDLLVAWADGNAQWDATAGTYHANQMRRYLAASDAWLATQWIDATVHQVLDAALNDAGDLAVAWRNVAAGTIDGTLDRSADGSSDGSTSTFFSTPVVDGLDTHQAAVGLDGSGNATLVYTVASQVYASQPAQALTTTTTAVLTGSLPVVRMTEAGNALLVNATGWASYTAGASQWVVTARPDAGKVRTGSVAAAPGAAHLTYTTCATTGDPDVAGSTCESLTATAVTG